MLTYHVIGSTNIGTTSTWIYPMLLLLLLLLSLSVSPSSIEAFGVTSVNGNVAAKTTRHTHHRLAASRCIDKYNQSRCKNSGGSGSCYFSTCNKPHHSSLTLSLSLSLSLSSHPTRTSLGGSSLLLLNSKKTAISDDAIGNDVSYNNTVSDDNNNNDNSNDEACSKTDDYQNPIVSNVGNNCSPTKSKTTSSSIKWKFLTMGRSAVTMGLVTVMVLGGLDYMIPTTAAAATATSDDIKELKVLIVELAIKSDQNAIKSDQNAIRSDQNAIKSDQKFIEVNEKLVELKTGPMVGLVVNTLTVLTAAIINTGAIIITQFMTDKSIRASENAFTEKVRTSENAFTEKVDRTAESFRSSLIVSMGIYITIFVVFCLEMSKQG